MSVGSHWDHKIEIPSLLPLEPSPAPTRLSFVRTGLDGRITGLIEIPNERHKATGATSTSLNRAPAPSNNFVRGKTGYKPFWPGGMDDAILNDGNVDSKGTGKQKGLRTVAPGLTRGFRAPGEKELDEADSDLLELDDSLDQTSASHYEVGPTVRQIRPHSSHWF